MPAKLSTHVLDTAHGRPAAGVQIELWHNGRHLKTAVTNADGRTEAPLLNHTEITTGAYELKFFIGDYFGQPPAERFLDVVTIAFRISDATAGYHVPLVCSPWSYSTYRGS